jgi:hypothetical protein
MAISRSIYNGNLVIINGDKPERLNQFAVVVRRGQGFLL